MFIFMNLVSHNFVELPLSCHTAMDAVHAALVPIEPVVVYDQD